MNSQKKAMPSHPRSTPTLRRMAALSLCAVGLAGLLACSSSQKPSETVVREAPPIREAPPQSRPAPTAATAARAELPPGEPDIRVAALKDAPGLKLTTGSVEARVFNAAGAEIERIPANTAVQVLHNPSALVVNGSPLNEQVLRIESSSPNAVLRLNDQELSSRVIVYRQPRGLTIVAQLNLEEYLSGVLAGEVPFERWHPEALKAQAITSRSFAYYQIRKNAAELYDVESTVMSQVFRPGYRNNPILSAAINSTRGMTLSSNGAPFSAYFHSTCGDHTDPSSMVFPDRPAARPLVSVPCGYCSQSPSFRWKITLEKHALEQKLAGNFSPSQHLASIAFLDTAGAPIGPAEGGMRRVASVVIKRTDGSSFQMVANPFRLAVGAKDLKSMEFSQIVDRGSFIDVAGGGFGHGVGLCQWGSQGMAQAGYSHLQILGKYYAGATLTKIY